MSKYFIPKSNLHDWMIHCTLKHLNFVIMYSRRETTTVFVQSFLGLLVLDNDDGGGGREEKRGGDPQSQRRYFHLIRSKTPRHLNE